MVVASIKQQIHQLCNSSGENRNLFDLFYYAASHAKRKNYLDEYRTDIDTAHNLFRMEKLDSLISILIGKADREVPSNEVDDILVKLVWILFCNLADPLETNLEKYSKSQVKSPSSRYLQKSDLSCLLFQQQLPEVAETDNQSLLKTKLSLHPSDSNRSRYFFERKKRDDIFGALTMSSTTMDSKTDTTLSLPKLSASIAPSLINSYPAKKAVSEQSMTNLLRKPFVPPSDLILSRRDNVDDSDTACDVWQQAVSFDQTGSSLLEEPLHSWADSNSTAHFDAHNIFLSEASDREYQQVFDEFMDQPLLRASDMILIEESDLIRVLLYTCNGIASDLIVFDGQDFKLSLEFIRTRTIGPKSLERLVAPFLKMGSQFKHLCLWAQKFRTKNGLTTKAFAESLEIVLLIIEANTHEIRRQHEKNSLSILKATDALASLQFLVSNLYSLVSASAANCSDSRETGTLLLSSMYSIITTHKYEWIQKKHCQYLAILTWMMKRTMMPMMRWVAAWLLIPTMSMDKYCMKSIAEFDPYNEFFISCSDGVNFKFVSSFSFPGFLDQELALKIFRNGVWWRKIKDFQSSDALALMNTSLATVDLRWPIVNTKEYQLSIDTYCEARLHEWKNSMISKKMKYLSELEEAHHAHILSIQEKKCSKAIEDGLIERINEEAAKKRFMLKKSIEDFLEEKMEYEKRRREAQLEQDNHQREADFLVAEAHRRAFEQEEEMLTKSFAQAFKLLERKEIALIWRRKRIQLDAIRREWFRSLVWEPSEIQPITLECSSTKNLDPQENLSEKSGIPETNAPLNHSDENSIIDQDSDFSFHSADQAVEETTSSEKPSTISPSQPFVEKNESQSNDKSEPQLSSPLVDHDNSDKEYFDAVTDDSQTPSSDVTLLSSVEGDECFVNESAWEESKEINWLLYPGTAKKCFGLSNAISERMEPLSVSFQEITAIHEDLETIHSSLVSIESTLQSSVVYLWKKQAQMISSSTLSCFFSSIGPNDAEHDIRFHLIALHLFFLCGSADFCMLIRDRLFKDNGDYGLNLNGSPSNAATGKIDRYLADILSKVQQDHNSPIYSKIANFLSLNISGIKIGTDIAKNFRLSYRPPAPFDIVITETVLSRYSSFFSQLLVILQAQEALERIHQSGRWREEKIIKRDDGESCIITQFLQLSHVFLAGLERFIFQTAIQQPWRDLLLKIEQLGANCFLISKIDGQQPDLDTLLDMHMQTLNVMSWRLFILNDDQRLVASLISKLLGLIISFSRAMQDVPTPDGAIFVSIPQLYFAFHSAHQSLVRLLRDSLARQEFGGVKYPDQDFAVFQELLSSIS